MITEKKLVDIIDTGYKDFAMYTLEQRAIPSAIDGFKNVQRKLVYAMATRHATGKVKVAELGGALSSLNYHHGESSAMGATIGMGAPWGNNEAIFESHGAFGTRLVQEAASPRYIFVSTGKAFKKFFIDTEVAPKNNDPDNPEPGHYLPTIPWLLVNGADGISVGFKTAILPRSLKDVHKATLECLKDSTAFLKKGKVILPTFPQFSGNVEHVEGNQYRTTGIIEYVGKYTFKISELPIGYDRASYVNVLEDLCDKGLIKDYDDGCSKSGFGFSIKVSLSQKADIDKDPIKYFKLAKTHTEIFTTLGYDGKLKIFQSVPELIHYFVEYRTVKMSHKIAHDIQTTDQEILRLRGQQKFIRYMISVDLKKTKKSTILEWIKENISEEPWALSFVNMAVYRFTSDEVAMFDASIAKAEEDLVALKQLDPQSFYLQKLNEVSKI